MNRSAALQQWGGDQSMEWRSLPEDAGLSSPVQWVGRENGEDVAWVIEWCHWGDQRHRWTVATPHGSAYGLRHTLQEAQWSAEQVLLVYRTPGRSY
jgi:hypothetical protein